MVFGNFDSPKSVRMSRDILRISATAAGGSGKVEVEQACHVAGPC
jgi:hypothetical protein